MRWIKSLQISGSDGMASFNRFVSLEFDLFATAIRLVGGLPKAWAVTVVVPIALIGCGAKEPQKLSMTGVVYNYTDKAVAAVRVNGRNVSAVMDGVEPGGVSGGAGACCVEINEGATEAQVEVDLGDASYSTQATVEQWWPDLAHYAVVHVLPGKRVVIEMRSVETWPRQDLLEQQLTAAGVAKKVNFSGPMNTGPMERAGGVK